MKEMKITYSLKEDGDRCNITRKNARRFKFKLGRSIFAYFSGHDHCFKENGTPKESTQAMMNEIVDMVYRMHSKHSEK